MALPLLLAADLPRGLGIAPPAIGLFGMIGLWLTGDKKPALPHMTFSFIAPVLVLGFISALWALDPGGSFGRAGKLAAIMVFSALLLGVAGKIKISSLRPGAWLIPAALLAGAALITFELNFGAPLHRLFREPQTLIPDAVFNRGATTYVICAVPALAILRCYLNPRIVYALFGVIFAALMLSIESQSAQLALLLALLFMIAFPYRRKGAWVALGITIAVLIIAAPFLAITAFAALAEPLNAIPFFKQGYAGARLEIWDYVSRYALQRPLTGYGLEASRVITDFDSAQIYQQGTSILHPHNFALQLWLEFGVIGAAFGVAFCAKILQTIYKLKESQARLCLPVFIACLSVAATGYGMWQSWWIGLLFLASALCIIALRMENQNEN